MPIRPAQVPELDLELRSALTAMGVSTIAVGYGPTDIAEARAGLDGETPSLDDLRSDARFELETREAISADGTSVPLLISRPSGVDATRPVLYATHGGGLIAGGHRFGLPKVLDLAAELRLAVVSVEYRLAPEHPHPAALQDALAGYEWVTAHVGEGHGLADRIIVYGPSAGGNLAAALTLWTRDHGLQTPVAQMLISPMLDDRNDSGSAAQMIGRGCWDQVTNDTAWDAVLGPRRRDPSKYAAPAREHDLTGLPPTYLEVGSAETFRDETVHYAQKLWAAGANAELHVWPGAFHSFDAFVPAAALSRQATRTRTEWLRRTLADDTLMNTP